LNGAGGRALLPLLLGLLLCAGRAAAQEDARFSLRVGSAAEGWRPMVRVDALLDDAVLRQALDSGLPLRVRLRVELWQKQIFDRLVDAQEISIAMVQDPLDRQYLLDQQRGERRLPSLAALQAAVAATLRPDFRPSGTGRFYYLGTLQVETLSLTDLEELRRWLRGEVVPAIGGERPAERAIETGMRRLIVRVLGIPTRSFEARSATFTLR
jgi:hypothetical protein